MRRVRLRALADPEELAEMYATPHDHRLYGRGHGERVAATIALARTISARTGADLSCGNGAILAALDLDLRIMGDLASSYEHCGPIEHTVGLIPDVDLFICSETLEHLDDPDTVLAVIRAQDLILSTPLEAWEDDNIEHLWAYDREAVEQMMTLAGWTPTAHVQVDSRVYGEPYLYGIWAATREAGPVRVPAQAPRP